MPEPEPNVPPTAGASDPRPGQFPATHWSVVLAARKPDDRQAAQAMETLCRAYWLPIYSYIRRAGQSPDDAQDLTQAFFARVIEKNYVHQADRERGRFRSFLLGALKHFLADDWDRQQARKRGGGCTWLSLDDAEAETRYQLEATGDLSPDRTYDRRWALALMEQAMRRLEEEYATWGRREVFRALRPLMAGGRDAGFAQIATQIDLTEGAVKMTVQRMRRRFRELLRDEVRQTVASDDDAGDELRLLLQLLGD